MAKNNKGVNELKKTLATLTDSSEKIFPNGKKIIIFELSKNDFNTAKKQFDIENDDLKRFNVDISGVEILFIEDGLLNTEEGNF